MNLTQLTEKQQLDVYALTHDKTGISQVVLEKDWWVTKLRYLKNHIFAAQI